MTFDFASLESAILGSTLPGTVAIADALGVTKRTVNRYRKSGLSRQKADALACRAGLHPACVWPGWVDETTHLFTRLRNQLAGTRWAA